MQQFRGKHLSEGDVGANIDCKECKWTLNAGMENSRSMREIYC